MWLWNQLKLHLSGRGIRAQLHQHIHKVLETSTYRTHYRYLWYSTCDFWDHVQCCYTFESDATCLWYYRCSPQADFLRFSSWEWFGQSLWSHHLWYIAGFSPGNLFKGFVAGHGLGGVCDHIDWFTSHIKVKPTVDYCAGGNAIQ